MNIEEKKPLTAEEISALVASLNGMTDDPEVVQSIHDGIKALETEAKRWRWWTAGQVGTAGKLGFVWSAEYSGSIRWVRYIRMKEPNISYHAKTDVKAQLNAWIDYEVAKEEGHAPTVPLF